MRLGIGGRGVEEIILYILGRWFLGFWVCFFFMVLVLGDDLSV